MTLIRSSVLTAILAGAFAASLGGAPRPVQPASQAQQTATAATGPTSAPFWTGMTSVAAFEHAMDGRLAHARALLAQLIAVTGARTLDNTLRVYDDLQIEIDAVSQQAQLIQSVHPDAAMRDAAEKVSQKASALNTEVSLNRSVFDAIQALDVTAARRSAEAPGETEYYLKRLLRDFRLAGVDKDEATRKRIQALRDELTEIGQAFDRNIRGDLRTVKTRASSKGCPATTSRGMRRTGKGRSR